MLAFFMPTAMLRVHFLGLDASGRLRDAIGAQGLDKACARMRRRKGCQHGDARAINSREAMAGVTGFHLQPSATARLNGCLFSSRSIANVCWWDVCNCQMRRLENMLYLQMKLLKIVFITFKFHFANR